MILDGGYVRYDARAGDVIFLEGRNHQVLETYPYGVRLQPTTGDLRAFTASYDRLLRDKAYYAAQLIPCRKPEGA